jgi:hypothetical protein
MYYAVGKIAVAAMPFAQTEACLACANDATIPIITHEWEKTITALGKAASDWNNGLTEVLNALS